MASSRAFVAALFLLLLALYHVDSRPVLEPGRSLLGVQALDCGGACKVRCSRSSRPNLCHRACGTCCARCQCVPPGTYGNYQFCPCYGKLTTRGGRPKCP